MSFLVSVADSVSAFVLLAPLFFVVAGISCFRRVYFVLCGRRLGQNEFRREAPKELLEFFFGAGRGKDISCYFFGAKRGKELLRRILRAKREDKAMQLKVQDQNTTRGT